MVGLGRITSSAKVVAGVFASLVTFLVYMWIKTTLDDKWYYKPAPCQYPADVWEDYIILLQKLTDLLKKQRITFFLCYGSLWGAIRYQRSLEWDTDLDLCVLSEEIHAIDPSSLLNMFRWEDFALDYSAREGKYEVRFGKATADLVVFEPSSDGLWMERIGWESRLFSNLESNHFPAELIKRPLPTVRFHNLQVPAPREEIEIMKYFYPDDWWKEVRPPGC